MPAAFRQFFPRGFRNQVFHRGFGNAHLPCEFLSTLSHQNIVAGLVHQRAGDVHRMFKSANRADRAGFQGIAVHNGSVKRKFALLVQESAASDAVHLRIALHAVNAFDHRIHRASAGLQKFRTGFGCLAGKRPC